MKRVVAALVTIAIVGLMTWSALRRPVAPPPSSDGPVMTDRLECDREAEGASDCIESLLASARRGDVDAYLAAFASPLKARLEHEAADRGTTDFGARLKQAAQARKGHAVFPPTPDGPGSTAVRITVESTYADRLERQTYRLERTAAGWRVSEVEMARGHVPGHLPGTLASYEEPEGVPVAPRAKDD
jgi:hypothetical protein